MAPAALDTDSNGAANGASGKGVHQQDDIQCDAPPPVKVTTVDQLHALQKKTKPATPRTATPRTPQAPEDADKSDSALKSIR